MRCRTCVKTPELHRLWAEPKGLLAPTGLRTSKRRAATAICHSSFGLSDTNHSFEGCIVKKSELAHAMRDVTTITALRPLKLWMIRPSEGVTSQISSAQVGAAITPAPGIALSVFQPATRPAPANTPAHSPASVLRRRIRGDSSDGLDNRVDLCGWTSVLQGNQPYAENHGHRAGSGGDSGEGSPAQRCTGDRNGRVRSSIRTLSAPLVRAIDECFKRIVRQDGWASKA